MQTHAHMHERSRQVNAAVGVVGAVVVVAVAWGLGLVDPVSFLITVGGTLAVTRATFSGEDIRAAWHQVGAALRTGRTNEDEVLDGLILTFKRLARAQRVGGPRGLERAMSEESDPFVRAAMDHVLACNDPDDLRVTLLGEARRELAHSEETRLILLTLGKLFPAFGLIGTLVGLALILQMMNSADMSALAPALGVSVPTTLYGAVLANMVVLPLAGRLETYLLGQRSAMRLVIEGAVMVQRGEYPTVIERMLRARAGSFAVDVETGPMQLVERAA